jgi:hypothetical protein
VSGFESLLSHAVKTNESLGSGSMATEGRLHPAGIAGVQRTLWIIVGSSPAAATAKNR